MDYDKNNCIMPKFQKIIRKETDRIIFEVTSESFDMMCHSDRWFRQARDEALKSNFDGPKVGCVIVYQNRVIGRGHNQTKTDPNQERYNIQYRHWIHTCAGYQAQGHTIHAEMDALKNIPYTVKQQVKWNKVAAFVYRVAPGLEGYSGLALPCEACAHALSDAGLRHVYYTTGHVDHPFGHADL